jgi:hypothetical protein
MIYAAKEHANWGNCCVTAYIFEKAVVLLGVTKHHWQRKYPYHGFSLLAAVPRPEDSEEAIENMRSIHHSYYVLFGASEVKNDFPMEREILKQMKAQKYPVRGTLNTL